MNLICLKKTNAHGDDGGNNKGWFSWFLADKVDLKLQIWIF